MPEKNLLFSHKIFTYKANKFIAFHVKRSFSLPTHTLAICDKNKIKFIAVRASLILPG